MRLAVAALLALTLVWTSPASAQSTTCAEAGPVPRPQGRTLLFDQFIQPLLDQSVRSRAQSAAEDPLYAHRVDADLNAHRLNIALLGYGEEHEQTYGDTGISVTILSLDL